MYRDIFIGKKVFPMYFELRDEKNIFSTYLDIFKNAAIVGCLLNYEKYYEEEKADESRNRIPQSVIINNKEEFDTLVNVICFIHYSRMKESKILQKVFLDTDEIILSKQEIVENYARGGIEKLYNNILLNTKTQEDIMENIVELVDNCDETFRLVNNMGSLEDIINRFL